MGWEVLIGIGGTLLGCFVGLAGWLSGHDKKIFGDAEWRGTVNTKLDSINTSIVGVSVDVKGITSTLSEHGVEIAKLDQRVESVECRVDRLENK